MAPTRRLFLRAATASTVVGLAGCGDGSGGSSGETGSGGDSGSDSDTGSGGDTPTETETPTAVQPGATVETSAHPDLGEILVDGDGMTLYMFDSDTQGELASTCTEGCAEAWPPLTIEGDPAAGEDVTADLETFEREDGSTQVAANGWPLYYFQNDESPGDANGQGVNDVWWVLGPDGTPKRPDGATVAVREHSDLGEILVDGDGIALYMFESDTQSELASTCTEGCADAWPPLTTGGTPSSSDTVTAELETFEREDGSTQVAANGWPLYYFQNDESPGDANGQGVNEVWWVLTPDGRPIRDGDASSTDGY